MRRTSDGPERRSRVVRSPELKGRKPRGATPRGAQVSGAGLVFELEGKKLVLIQAKSESSSRAEKFRYSSMFISCWLSALSDGKTSANLALFDRQDFSVSQLRRFLDSCGRLGGGNLNYALKRLREELEKEKRKT